MLEAWQWQAILFYGALIILIYVNRSKLQFQGIIGVYRTKVGLKLMDSWGKRYREFVRLYGLVGVGVGFVGMAVVIYQVLFSLYFMVKEKWVLDGSPVVLPGLPLAGLGVVFPLFTGLIALFIIIAIHEFSHGVVARSHNIKVKSSGLAILGPFPGAFVEPDEKQLKKASDVVQYSVYAAGPWANFVLTGVVVLLMMFVLSPSLDVMSEQKGLMIQPYVGYPAHDANISSMSIVEAVNGVEVYTFEDIAQEMQGVLPGDAVTLQVDGAVYEVETTANPNNSSKAFLGIAPITKMQNQFGVFLNNQPFGMWAGAGLPVYMVVSWLYKLFLWVAFLSAVVGIINLLPFFITDGARMLQLAFQKIYADEEKAKRYFARVNVFFLWTILLSILIPLYFKIVEVVGVL
ncbi:site-2 protease family protein [Candidatus Woesearchaeota archaeon]|nr:site-2 protease family protein [Candidatus Woesearchaeota archaeon]